MGCGQKRGTAVTLPSLTQSHERGRTTNLLQQLRHVDLRNSGTLILATVTASVIRALQILPHCSSSSTLTSATATKSAMRALRILPHSRIFSAWTFVATLLRMWDLRVSQQHCCNYSSCTSVTAKISRMWALRVSQQHCCNYSSCTSVTAKISRCTDKSTSALIS
ncbi:Hypothetical protein, putative [Bodo saltans]|uniref:Uncharacterized protein n=1 Tax=Bodo saltans TaxID=75058 RepID=A0A0S4JMC2_BODSA|nr:Hypothetical protein, putative [Bodo saltans]|eukprot:CUG91789.1 Hypothetical protein, putative [Bodo saltans]